MPCQPSHDPLLSLDPLKPRDGSLTLPSYLRMLNMTKLRSFAVCLGLGFLAYVFPFRVLSFRQASDPGGSMTFIVANEPTHQKAST